MKSPDEILIGMECCKKYMNGAPEEECCHVCNYQYSCAELKLDALALIRQLEAENAQLKQERDAVLQFITQYAHNESDGGGDFCEVCNKKHCKKCCNHNEGFEWRGLCEENGGKES